MSYFVTGATGFIGHNLIPHLLKRRGKIYVLVRKGSREKLENFIAGWGPSARKRVSASVELRPSRLLRCGKRPYSATMS